MIKFLKCRTKQVYDSGFARANISNDYNMAVGHKRLLDPLSLIFLEMSDFVLALFRVAGLQLQPEGSMLGLDRQSKWIFVKEVEEILGDGAEQDAALDLGKLELGIVSQRYAGQVGFLVPLEALAVHGPEQLLLLVSIHHVWDSVFAVLLGFHFGTLFDLYVVLCYARLLLHEPEQYFEIVVTQLCLDFLGWLSVCAALHRKFLKKFDDLAGGFFEALEPH